MSRFYCAAGDCAMQCDSCAGEQPATIEQLTECDTPEEARADMADWLEKHADKCERDGDKAIPVPANYRLAAQLLREAKQ